MDVIIRPSPLRGEISAIGSKSDAHRLLIAAALSDGACTIQNVTKSEDIAATIAATRALGAEIEQCGDCCRVTPIDFGRCKAGELAELNCGESGSTLRFLLPVAAALYGGTFYGRGRLPERPQGALLQALRGGGCVISGEKLPLTVSGGLKAGCFTLPCDVSSQFVSGLLFALPLLSGDSEIVIDGTLQSAGYVRLTVAALRRFGVVVEQTETGYFVAGNQRYSVPTGERKPYNIEAAGDYSNAAFFLAAGAFSDGVTVLGLQQDGLQGDHKILELLRQFGARVECGESAITVQRGTLHGQQIDCSQIPDLLPILAVVAAGAEGETHFFGAARLRLKESDRIKTTAALLRALCCEVKEGADSLTVYGRGGRFGVTGSATVDGAGDHRIVMAAAIAGAICGCRLRISGAEAVNKSYPRFFDDFNKLGGNADVV